MNRSASRLVVFDFDGTIADTWRDIAQALNRTLESVDLPTVHGPDVRFWIGAGVLPLLERAVPEEWKGPDRLEQLYERFREHYRRLCLETTEPYRGIPECLEQLSGEHLAIASNKPAVFLDQILVGLDVLIDLVGPRVGNEDHAVHTLQNELACGVVVDLTRHGVQLELGPHAGNVA